jgi:hypothetical protein
VAGLSLARNPCLLRNNRACSLVRIDAWGSAKRSGLLLLPVCWLLALVRGVGTAWAGWVSGLDGMPLFVFLSACTLGLWLVSVCDILAIVGEFVCMGFGIF